MDRSPVSQGTVAPHHPSAASASGAPRVGRDQDWEQVKMLNFRQESEKKKLGQDALSTLHVWNSSVLIRMLSKQLRTHPVTSAFALFAFFLPFIAMASIVRFFEPNMAWADVADDDLECESPSLCRSYNKIT